MKNWKIYKNIVRLTGERKEGFERDLQAIKENGLSNWELNKQTNKQTKNILKRKLNKQTNKQKQFKKGRKTAKNWNFARKIDPVPYRSIPIWKRRKGIENKWTGLSCQFSVDGLGLNLLKFEEKKIEKFISFGFRKKKTEMIVWNLKI